jgi:hypothetical protein
MNNNKLKLIILTIIASMIAWQSYQVYQIEKKLDFAQKNGLLKCKKPK